ncbi:PLP-dependent aminotransferase family protein [Paenibacillus sp. NFR01]|uniref:aminotransferase-like domain-containing protein n=1 Tax=Paenibacillus sp. NFR01 TaxID=1566279 RepID=UPI0008B832CA|nr:PLP-dependent aminotransferase family protein [Paenibacillus sp. NFR01]SET65125.1 2-aminoadipate transaminase [Paenibacillus sp. NFR01]
MKIPYSQAAQHLGSSAVREILKLTQGGNIISLAGGLPAEETFPLEAVREAYAQALSVDASALQYGLTEGYTPLREAVAARLTAQGIPAGADDLLLTTGSQQAIDLVCKMLLDPGDAVLVEAPTYLAALQVLGSYRAAIHAVESDDEGMLPDHLERQILQWKAKLLYAVPTFNNPTGATWSRKRREQVLELCRKYGVLILEDNPYGEIAFDETPGARPPAIAGLDRSSGGESIVVYTGTFSKIVAPALRTGWLVGPQELIRTVAKAKQAADLHSSTIDQRALYELLQRFDLDGHIRRISREYHARMLRLASGLRASALPDAAFREPAGGMFLWLALAGHIRTAELLPYAVEQGVAFVPGEVFYAAGPLHNTMRLNFTHTPPELVPLAISRLEQAVAQYDAHRRTEARA